MKERSIICKDWEVRAILDGRKTMTRRVVDPRWQGIENAMPMPKAVECASGATMEFPGRTPGDFLFYTDMPVRDGAWQPVGCPYGQPGDRLWVRETWRLPEGAPQGWVDYKADDTRQGFKWRPSIHMPRRASRIDLDLVSVRVERLLDITDEDAIQEGITEVAPGDRYPYGVLGGDNIPRGKTPRAAFLALWESINGCTYPASDNAWVWVLGIPRVKA